MINRIKETFDIQIQHPRALPAVSPCGTHCFQCRSSGTIPVGPGMKDRLQLRFQVHLDNHLGDAIPNRWNPKRSSLSVGLRDVHTSYRRWKIASGRHSVPDLIQIILEILFKLLQGHLINTTCASIRLHTLVGQTALDRCSVMAICRLPLPADDGGPNLHHLWSMTRSVST